MLAIDHSIISGLRTENGLLKEELQQLKNFNEKLMVKIDIFEAKDLETDSITYQKNEIEEGLSEIIDRFNEKQNNNGNSLKNQISKITAMMETFCFDHLTQIKFKYKTILGKMKADFCEEIEQLNEIIAKMGLETHDLIKGFESKLKKASNTENELREKLKDFKTKFETKCELFEKIKEIKTKIEMEKNVLEGKLPIYK